MYDWSMHFRVPVYIEAKYFKRVTLEWLKLFKIWNIWETAKRTAAAHVYNLSEDLD